MASKYPLWFLMSPNRHCHLCFPHILIPKDVSGKQTASWIRIRCVAAEGASMRRAHSGKLFCYFKLCPFCLLISGHGLDARALTVLNFTEETSSGAEGENCHSWVLHSKEWKLQCQEGPLVFYRKSNSITLKILPMSFPSFQVSNKSVFLFTVCHSLYEIQRQSLFRISS